jgi:DNA-binding NarL/FixJ family response regulator
MTSKNQPSKKSGIRILIVDDHPVVREGLAMQIATQPDLEICGEAEDLPGALNLLTSTRPHVAIIDISLKNDNGIELIRRIKARQDDVQILVWSMYPESLYAERALRAGAKGYLNKGRATRELLDAIRAVLAGKIYISGDLAGHLVRQVAQGEWAQRSPMDRLSDRELQAFEFMGYGQTTEDIAARMHVSPKTVETYRGRIKEKLGLSKNSQLIQQAAQWVLENKQAAANG